MLEAQDIEAAVAAGIITAPQAEALREIADKRLHERAALLSHEERFRFMSGFNDFFFALGIILFGAGLMFFTGIAAVDSSAVAIGANLAAACLIWLLAELLVRRMRLVLPGILLSILFVLFVFRAVPATEWLAQWGGQYTRPIVGADKAGGLLSIGLLFLAAPLNVAAKALIAASAAAIYYARFRLPFTLLTIAASLVLAVLATTATVSPAAAYPLIQTLMILGCGLAVFALAMTFDISDRERLTRRADCAFWLHLLAAPLIVHSLISLVAPSALSMRGEGAAAGATLSIVAVLAIVAIVIDRRALLVSALAYVGIVIGMAISSTGGWVSQPGSNVIIFFATLLILGIFVITLGIGWMPLRRRLMALMSSGLVRHLSPVPVSP